MEKNVGTPDRVVRIIIALALGALIFFGMVQGIPAILTGIAAAYLLITALIGRCLVYSIGGFDTCVAEGSYSTTDDRAGF